MANNEVSFVADVEPKQRNETNTLLNGVQGNLHPGSDKRRRTLIVEDLREACSVLKVHGHDCDRITHNELMASPGEEYLGKLLRGEYGLLWIAAPFM